MTILLLAAAIFLAVTLVVTLGAWWADARARRTAWDAIAVARERRGPTGRVPGSRHPGPCPRCDRARRPSDDVDPPVVVPHRARGPAS